MSDCNGGPADRYLEPYLRNTLPEAEARQFEEHYYGCEVCLAQLEALEAVELKLGRQPRKAPGVLLYWPTAAYAATAIAAMLLIGFFSWRSMTVMPALNQQARTQATAPIQGPQSPAPAAAPSVPPLLHQLADLNFPVFRLSNVRGEKVNPALQEGMRAYARHDCPATVRALSQVTDQAPEAPMARLYSGVCLMHEGDLPRSAQTLKAATVAPGTPEQEAASYYLAQVALIRNDGSLARHYLILAISSHGDFEGRARGQLRQIPAHEPHH